MKSTALRWLPGIALAGLVGIALAYRNHFDAAALQAWVRGAGAAGPVVFILIYAAATVPFLPGAVITLAGGAGALFGPVWGGDTLGAALAFLIARHLGHGRRPGTENVAVHRRARRGRRRGPMP